MKLLAGSQHALNVLFILCFGMLGGCAVLNDAWNYFKPLSYEDILKIPSAKWRNHECRAVIAANIEHNIYTADSDVNLSAMPFVPAVITALNRQSQRRKDWTVEQYRENFAQDVKRYLGFTCDWERDSLVDAHGEVYRNEHQLDSLLFLISLKPTIPTQPPDISDLKNRVFLENETGQLLRPQWLTVPVQMLMNDETIFIMFQLKTEEYDFLRTSKKMNLLFTGFKYKIRLSFDLER